MIILLFEDYPSSAEELLSIAEQFSIKAKVVLPFPNMTEAQYRGLIAARDFRFSPTVFRFQALVERWSMEELLERLTRLKCPT